jgi:hypothetical protein
MPGMRSGGVGGGGGEMALEVSQLMAHVYQRPLTTVPEHNVTAHHMKEEEEEEELVDIKNNNNGQLATISRLMAEVSVFFTCSSVSMRLLLHHFLWG